MLILTRRINEEIVISNSLSPNNPTRLVVLGVKGGQVRLGIKANPDISVHRLEVYERIAMEAQSKSLDNVCPGGSSNQPGRKNITRKCKLRLVKNDKEA